MPTLADRYRGGNCIYVEPPNGGFYVTPTTRRSNRIVMAGSRFTSTPDAERVGSVASPFALSHLSIGRPQVG